MSSRIKSLGLSKVGRYDNHREEIHFIIDNELTRKTSDVIG
jgi:hypothetical protein